MREVSVEHIAAARPYSDAYRSTGPWIGSVISRLVLIAEQFHVVTMAAGQTPQPAPRAEYAAEFLSTEIQPENMRCAALAAVL